MYVTKILTESNYTYVIHLICMYEHSPTDRIPSQQVKSAFQISPCLTRVCVCVY